MASKLSAITRIALDTGTLGHHRPIGQTLELHSNLLTSGCHIVAGILAYVEQSWKWEVTAHGIPSYLRKLDFLSRPSESCPPAREGSALLKPGRVLPPDRVSPPPMYVCIHHSTYHPPHRCMYRTFYVPPLIYPHLILSVTSAFLDLCCRNLNSQDFWSRFCFSVDDHLSQFPIKRHLLYVGNLRLQFLDGSKWHISGNKLALSGIPAPHHSHQTRSLPTPPIRSGNILLSVDRIGNLGTSTGHDYKLFCSVICFSANSWSLFNTRRRVLVSLCFSSESLQSWRT